MNLKMKLSELAAGKFILFSFLGELNNYEVNIKIERTTVAEERGRAEKKNSLAIHAARGHRAFSRQGV